MKLSNTVFAALALFFCAALCGCMAQPSASSEVSVSESAAESVTQESEVGEDDEFLLGVDLTHPDDADRTARATVYMLFVKQDGTVISTEYCNDKGYDFFGKRSRRDPDIWDQVEPAKELGKLSETECSKIAEAVANTNPEAERYTRDSDQETPDVQETYHLTYYLYLSGNSPVYVAYSAGEEMGVSIRSEDPNAMEAVRIIKGTELFQQWLQNNL